MSSKILCFITDKILKSCYALLLIVLMTLWIVLCVEATRQINEISHKVSNGKHQKLDEAHRRMTPIHAASSATAILTRSGISRLYTLTIFNTLLEEVIALCAVLSLILRIKRIFVITLMLLIVIWFIEQYRISDFYHQIDYIDMQSSQIIIATHVIHFVIIVIGIVLVLTDNIGLVRLTNPSDSGQDDCLATKKSASSFVDLEKNQTKEKLFERSEKSAQRCKWMRHTFIKRNKAKQDEKQAVSIDNSLLTEDKPRLSDSGTKANNGQMLIDYDSAILERNESNFRQDSIGSNVFSIA